MGEVTKMPEPPAYHVPRQFTLSSPFASFITVRGPDGKVLDKVEGVDLDEGWVEFRNWSDEGQYAPIRKTMAVTLEVAASAPAAAKEWFKIPLGQDGTRVHSRNDR